MTKEQIKDQLIEKQDKLIKVLVKIIYKHYDKFSASNDSKGTIIKLEDELADLNQQLKEAESEPKEDLFSDLKGSVLFPNRPNPQDVNPYNGRAILRKRKK